MSGAPSETRASARKFEGAMLDHPALSLERLPGLAPMLDEFAANVPGALAALIESPIKGAIEEIRVSSLFRSLSDCRGLTAAVFHSAELDARLAIVLDEAIAELVVNAVFGAGDVRAAGEPESDKADEALTAVEIGLVEEFARGLGRAFQAALAPLAEAVFAFERLVRLTDDAALGRRDMPAAAARLTMATSAGPCECIVVMPQTLLLPLRERLAPQREGKDVAADPLWSEQMEAGVAQARLPMAAILEELTMTLGEVAKFDVGHIVPLQAESLSRVRLDCAGRGVFWCKLGQGDGRYLLEVEDAGRTEAEHATRGR